MFLFLCVHLYSYLTLNVMPPFFAGKDKWVLERRHLNERSTVTKAPTCLFTSISLWFSCSQGQHKAAMIKEKWRRKRVCLTFLITGGSKSKFQFFFSLNIFSVKLPKQLNRSEEKWFDGVGAEALDASGKPSWEGRPAWTDVSRQATECDGTHCSCGYY